MVLTDTHCHLDFSQYDPDRTTVLERAWKAGLKRILVPGIDLRTSMAGIKLAELHKNIYASVGVHPNSALSWINTSLGELERLSEYPKVVAIGEIGLDYFRDRAPKKQQWDVFCRQLDFASKVDLPVIIHTRNSSLGDRSCISDVINILRDWNSNGILRGVVHSYSGNEVEARKLIKLGFFIGITGPITYKNAESLRQLVAKVPLERLLIETDGPFLTPHPHRGKRNEPSFVRFIAERIAEVQNCTWQVVANQTTNNATSLFKWRDVG